MAISREKALDLAQRLAERLKKTPGVAVSGGAEYVSNLALRAFLDWDKEVERLSAEAARRVRERGRAAEGSREWDLLNGEELERLLAAEIARGE